MKVIIVGGGFVGQLIHTLVPMARVFDWRPTRPETPPRQLGPQYLWEPIPGLKCREFNVVTHIDGRKANEATIRAYKHKVGKTQDGGDWRAQFRENMPGYDVELPPDRVEYGMRIVSIDAINRTMCMADGSRVEYDALISTIPLDAMAQLCGIRRTEPPLESRPIFLWTRPVTGADSIPAIEAHQNHCFYVNYISHMATEVYRETLRDNKWHFESLGYSDIPKDVRVHKLMPGKIYNNTAAAGLRQSLFDLGIVTFGRYASWHPDELAHETYKNAATWVNEYVK